MQVLVNKMPRPPAVFYHRFTRGFPLPTCRASTGLGLVFSFCVFELCRLADFAHRKCQKTQQQGLVGSETRRKGKDIKLKTLPKKGHLDRYILSVTNYSSNKKRGNLSIYQGFLALNPCRKRDLNSHGIATTRT